MIVNIQSDNKGKYQPHQSHRARKKAIIFVIGQKPSEKSFASFNFLSFFIAIYDTAQTIGFQSFFSASRQLLAVKSSGIYISIFQPLGFLNVNSPARRLCSKVNNRSNRIAYIVTVVAVVVATAAIVINDRLYIQNLIKLSRQRNRKPQKQRINGLIKKSNIIDDYIR